MTQAATIMITPALRDLFGRHRLSTSALPEEQWKVVDQISAAAKS